MHAQHAKFSRGLAQTSPSGWLNRATGNAEAMYNLAARLQQHGIFRESLLHFSKFLVNANFNFITNYISRDSNKQCWVKYVFLL